MGVIPRTLRARPAGRHLIIVARLASDSRLPARSQPAGLKSPCPMTGRRFRFCSHIAAALPKIKCFAIRTRAARAG